MKPFGLQRDVVGSTAQYKTNSHYYREQMLKYEDDIEKLQAEVEKAREGRFKILSFFGTGELAEAKKMLSNKDKQIEKTATSNVLRRLTKSPIRIDIACHQVQRSLVFTCRLTIQTYQAFAFKRR